MRYLFFILCAGLFLAGLPVAAMGAFAVDGGVNDDDGVVNGVVTISTVKHVPLTVALYDQTASDFHIVSGGRLVLQSDSSFTTCWIRFANLTVDSGGEIEADEQGHDSNQVIGGGFTSITGEAGSGAGHGGHGGYGTGTTQYGETHGVEIAPTHYGSGGGPASITPGALGGRGGGIVLLEVQGQFDMNGVISADGGDGLAAGPGAGGGGSGGSIHILTNVISGGSGTFSARGGDGGVNVEVGGGGGGGGRIYIRCNDDQSLYQVLTGAFLVGGGSASTAVGATDGVGGTYRFEVHDPISVTETTWGRIKSLFR
jgi:hypothetical protein